MVDTTSVIDFRPIVDQIVVPIIIPVLGSLVSWAAWKVVSMVGLKVNAQQQQVVDQGLNMAINYASLKVEGFIPGKVNVDVHNSAVATAANYAMQHIPDALAWFGVTDKAALVSMIEARIGVMAGPTATITPPGTPPIIDPPVTTVAVVPVAGTP
jgi:hypothetical protein